MGVGGETWRTDIMHQWGVVRWAVTADRACRRWYVAYTGVGGWVSMGRWAPTCVAPRKSPVRGDMYICNISVCEIR